MKRKFIPLTLALIMTCLVSAGVIGGSNGLLTPTDTTTRAEMAQVLYNLLKD